MYNNTKKIILAISILCSIFASAYATDMGTTSGTQESVHTDSWTFAMQEVKVEDLNTLKIVFNKDLLQDTAMFEFLLTSKKDDTKEIVLTGMTLSSANELTAKTVESLTQDEEYNLVVVFASDKEGNVIENGVDGMITFKAGTTTAETTQSGELNAAAETDSEMTPASTETPVSTETETPALDAAAPATESGVTAEAVAGSAETLPQTGPKEVMIVILAMLLGFGIMYMRQSKRA